MMAEIELASLYRPIQGRLQQVEEKLKVLKKSPLPPLPPLLEHTVNRGGKRLRPALTLLANHLYRYDPRTVPAMAAAMELFHTATLVHDDIVDVSSLRRGQPTVNQVWGDGAALLLGDYLFAASAELVASTENLRVIHLFAQMLMAISASELAQSLSTLEERLGYQHYLEWIGAKTASVFATATQCGAILGEAPEAGVAALREYGLNLGIAFQMADDILDFTGEEADLGKPVGVDLLAGHPTLPTILFLERHPAGPQWRQRLCSGMEAGEREIKRLRELILASGLTAECYRVARDFATRAAQAIETLPSGEAQACLARLARYSVDRRR